MDTSITNPAAVSYSEATGNPEIDQLRRQFITFLNYRPDDAEQWRQAMQPDGSWNDIDYSNQQRSHWPQVKHLARINSLVNAWVASRNTGSHDHAMLKAALAALQYWAKNDYTNPNWWHQQIGTPLVLTKVMIMLGDNVTPELKNQLYPILDRSQPGKTGQNRVWKAEIHIMKGIVANDRAMIDFGIEEIYREITVSEQEGLQSDNSFHQHGPQMQLGNYGASFAETSLKWGNITRGTPWELPADKILLLRNFILHGQRTVCWNGYYDFNACGRQIFPDSPRQKADWVKSMARQAITLDPAAKNDYETILSPDAAITGNRYFWRSDFLVHRRPSFYFSVRMSSSRVVGAESCNSENIIGRLLGDGVYCLQRSGAEYDNIFPVWNWRQLPGLTAVQDNLPLLPTNKIEMPSDEVGGVSDGSNGMAVMRLERNGLSARKSWFCLGDRIVCLTAGLTTEEPATTTINQCLLNGPATVITGKQETVLTTGDHELRQVSEIRHDGFSYHFAAPTDADIFTGPAEGNWNQVYSAGTTEKITLPVFKLILKHQPKQAPVAFAYHIAPTTDRQPLPQILSNTEKLQAVYDPVNGQLQAAWYQPGELHLPDGLTIRTDSAILLLLDKSSDGIKITLADPTRKLETVKLFFSAGFSGQNWAATADGSLLTVKLPSGGMAGGSCQIHGIISNR